MTNSTVLMQDSSISGWKNLNTAGYGGGLYLEHSAHVILARTSVVDNTVLLAGGGAYVSEGCTLLLRDNCIFQANAARTSGGAIHVQSDTAETVFIVRDSVFLNNNASFGGAVSIELTDGSLASSDIVTFDIQNSTFELNSARSFGGALRLAASGVVMNTTCNLNLALEAGEVK